MQPEISLSKIRIFPIKALDFVELKEVKTDVHSLHHDREFAIKSKDGRYINGKRTGRVNQLQAQFDLENYEVSLGERFATKKEKFELREGNKMLNEFLSDFFQMPAELVHKPNGELQDMPAVGSVTLVSTASLKELHKSFPEISLEDFRQRFRVNLELKGYEPFEEEILFCPKEEKQAVKFKIGEVEMQGISPRARCSVPPREPLNGDPDKEFVKKMMTHRQSTLPSNSLLTEYPNFYYLSINTFLAKGEKGKTLSLGDKLEILGKQAFSSLF
tara:strand:- start:6004 stop:6822 length:819 start_codon:yes stop_codon:yes gene_type:complete